MCIHIYMYVYVYQMPSLSILTHHSLISPTYTWLDCSLLLLVLTDYIEYATMKYF